MIRPTSSSFLAALGLTLLLGSRSLLADDAPPTPVHFVPPSPEVAKAAGLLPPDPVLPGGHHALLERWRDAFGLTMEQELWIEPQLHAEEALTKPVLHFKALTPKEQQQILLIIKLASRRQVKVLLTPEQQKLMDEEIESTKAASERKMNQS